MTARTSTPGRTAAVLLLLPFALPAQASRPSQELRTVAREAKRANKLVLVRSTPTAYNKDLQELDTLVAGEPAFHAAFVSLTWELDSPEPGDPEPRILQAFRGKGLGLAVIDGKGELLSVVDPSSWKTDGKWDRARIAAFVEYWTKPARTESRPTDRVTLAKKKYGPIYDPEADALADIDAAVAKAKAAGKHVLVMVGGNWCHWCYLLHDELVTRPELEQEVAASYVLLHVSWERDRRNEKAMARLDQPWRFGFPVLVVLDGTGKRLHTQDSGQLESGDRHDPRRVLKFLQMWSPAGLDGARLGR